MVTASLPTKYRVLGFSDLIAPKMTSATCLGEEELVCLNLSLTPSDTFWKILHMVNLDALPFELALSFLDNWYLLHPARLI